MILTAKHHDGFALWPSRYSDHTVEQSAWRDGEGDVVGAFVEAARTHGRKIGLYLSPWDRHEPTYGDESAYNAFYLGQLHELLTQYGPLEELWFDGAKGEDAEDMTYHFEAFWAMVRQHQPGAVCSPTRDPTSAGSETSTALRTRPTGRRSTARTSRSAAPGRATT